MFPMFAWILAIPVLGFLTGARSMTPIAVVCFFAWRHHLPLHDTWASWARHPVTVIVFAVLAFGEYIGDKLPSTPNRTALFPLLARIAFGGLVGALCATGLHGSAPEGIIFGACGALVGTFATYQIRRYFTQTQGHPDLYVALAEDVIVLAGSIFMLGIVTG